MCRAGIFTTHALNLSTMRCGNAPLSFVIQLFTPHKPLFVKSQNMFDFSRARINMVNGQLEVNKISSPELLEVYRNLPRELFVGPSLRETAYLDDHQMDAHGRYTLDPMIEALIIDQAIFGAEQWGEYGAESVLFLGVDALPCAAVLTQMAGHVHIVDPNADALSHAIASLHAAGIGNVTGHVGDCEGGVPDASPFDAIVLPGSTTNIPDILLDQLQVNGRFIAILRPHPRMQGRLLMITRLDDDRLMSHIIADANAPYAPEFAPQSEFSF